MCCFVAVVVADVEVVEVGEEVVEAFIQSGFESRIKYNYEKPHIDIKGCVYDSLIKAGLDGNNITVSDICTYCDEDFYSHRRMGNERGNMAAIAQLV